MLLEENIYIYNIYICAIGNYGVFNFIYICVTGNDGVFNFNLCRILNCIINMGIFSQNVMIMKENTNFGQSKNKFLKMLT